MAASEAAIANRGLLHLGVTGRITDLDTDETAEGTTIRTVFDGVVLETLKGAPWSCAKKVAALTLVETLEQTRDEEWLYSYRVPEDCVAPRRIRFYGNRNPARDQEVPFEQFADTVSADWAIGTTYATGEYARVTATGVWYRALRETVGDAPASSALDWVAITGGPPKLLHCDITEAVLEYTMLLTDPTRFEGDLEAAICARLAFEVAPSVTVNGSAVDLRGQVATIYNGLVSAAIANDAAQEKKDPPPPSGWELARHRPGRNG